MLSALVLGISAPGMELLREDTPGERARLLDALAPALSRARTGDSEPVVAISGRGTLVNVLSELLGRSGIRVLLTTDDRPPDDLSPAAAVLVGRWVLTPDMQSHWLRRDVPHLSIVFSDTGVTIGPVVTPGAGACLRCIELHRTAADPAWPAIASQLHGLGGGAETPILAAEAAAIAFRMLQTTLDEQRAPREGKPGESVHIDSESGERTIRHWMQHPECGCGGIDSILG
jgi:bacteriocin biosynthesis cyclodehydratase domain-containing protein